MDIYRSFAQGETVAKETINMDNHWLPFTPNRHFRENPRVFVAADGMYFTTDDGRKVLDGVSSLWCVGAGHNRKPINEAIKAQLDTLDYATAFQVGNDKAFKAAGMIAALAPGDLNKVLFCNSGSEAADTSMKVALAYHRARGEGHRNVFIGRERGYHGAGFGGMSVGGIPANRKVFGTAFLPRVDHLRFIHDPVNHAFINGVEPEWKEDLLLELEQRLLPLHDPSNIAAIMVEPVAGSAGWYVPPKGYLKRLREICDKHGILLIFDEVITGFGRLGGAFSYDAFGVKPDLMTMAKAINNATVPMGAVAVKQEVHDAIVNSAPEGGMEFMHGYTYSAHPLACAAANATLALYEKEQLFKRAGEMAPQFGAAAHALKSSKNVIDIRNFGMVAAIELAPREGQAGKRGYEALVKCFGKGLMIRTTGDTLAVSPPLIAEKQHVERIFSTIGEVLATID